MFIVYLTINNLYEKRPNMKNDIFPVKTLTILFSALFITACGGGDNFEAKNYDENQPPQRVDGELAFTSPSLMKMAETFRIAGDYTNAIRLYQRAATENPSHAPSRLALGQIYQRLGATDGAITYYRQALDLEPGNMDAQLGIGQMMVRSNNPAEAIKYLEEVAKKSPDNYRIYNSIGLAYDLQGLHENAQLAYGTGLNKKPDHISLLNNLALSFAIDGDYPPAIQLLSKAVNLDYSQTTAQMNLIMIYAMSGEMEAARNMANSFMTSEEIETNLTHYQWLSTLPSQRRAQAIFLNIKSFPDEDIINPAFPANRPIKTQPVVSMDPKKQMLFDILNEDKKAEQQAPIINSSNQSNKTVNISLEEISEAIALAAIAEETIAADEIASPNIHYRLQLGSNTSLQNVIKDWSTIQRRAPDLLDGTDINVDKIYTADDTEQFRLFIGGYDNFNAAKEYCDALQLKQVNCQVVEALMVE